MHAILNRISPSPTDQIRADHSRVLMAFHRYGIDSRPKAKQALVETICLAIEVHAQVEEELFYPALRAAGSELINEQLVPEHQDIRKLMAALRSMSPASDQYDATFMELMRTVIHHVADEETVLLPHAESVLGDALPALGRQMAKRRLELKVPLAARRMPKGSLLVGAGALLAGALMLRRFTHKRLT